MNAMGLDFGQIYSSKYIYFTQKVTILYLGWQDLAGLMKKRQIRAFKNLLPPLENTLFPLFPRFPANHCLSLKKNDIFWGKTSLRRH
jgi:hypothetical protein